MEDLEPHLGVPFPFAKNGQVGALFRARWRSARSSALKPQRPKPPQRSSTLRVGGTRAIVTSGLDTPLTSLPLQERVSTWLLPPTHPSSPLFSSPCLLSLAPSMPPHTTHPRLPSPRTTWTPSNHTFTIPPLPHRMSRKRWMTFLAKTTTSTWLNTSLSFVFSSYPIPHTDLSPLISQSALFTRLRGPRTRRSPLFPRA